MTVTMGINQWDMLCRVVTGALLGAAIGFERDRHGRQAGLRTHLIVGLASATFMLVSAHFYFFQNYGGVAGVTVDPSRIAASVVTGIGFLAGGTILKTGLTIQGLTTAAGLWLVAAIGLCAGSGMFTLAVAVTILGLLAMTVLRLLEGKNDRMSHRIVSLVLEDRPAVVSGLLSALLKAGALVTELGFEKAPTSSQIKIEFLLLFPLKLTQQELVAFLEQQDGVLGLTLRLPR